LLEGYSGSVHSLVNSPALPIHYSPAGSLDLPIARELAQDTPHNAFQFGLTYLQGHI
jgi:hypothetical protein